MPLLLRKDSDTTASTYHDNFYLGPLSGVCSLSLDPLASDILTALPNTDIEAKVSRLACTSHIQNTISIYMHISCVQT